jgi:hypothetical protein
MPITAEPRLPRGWTQSVRSGLLHAIALANAIFASLMSDTQRGKKGHARHARQNRRIAVLRAAQRAGSRYSGWILAWDAISLAGVTSVERLRPLNRPTGWTAIATPLLLVYVVRNGSPPYARHAEPFFRDYCGRHGYPLVFGPLRADADRHPAWQMLLVHRWVEADFVLVRDLDRKSPFFRTPTPPRS